MILPANLKHSFTYASAQVNVYHANKGEGLNPHDHTYTHATICHNGSCLVTLEGRSYTIDKNSKPLNLPPNQWHAVEALEDDTVFVNIFAEGKN